MIITLELEQLRDTLFEIKKKVNLTKYTPFASWFKYMYVPS